jgi:hypothetical protein
VKELILAVLAWLKKNGVEARVSEYWGEKEHPYLVISLLNVHLVDGEPTLEEK